MISAWQNLHNLVFYLFPMKKRILFLILLFLAWLPVFIIQKPWFLFYNRSMTETLCAADYFQVIWHGLKLDLTVAGYLTALPLLFVLISVWYNGDWLRKTLKGYFLIMAIIIAAIFVVDVALYAFWGFRMDATVLFYLKSPGDALASVPAGLFPVQSVAFLIYAYLAYKYLAKLVLPMADFKSAGNRWLTSLAILVLGGLMFIPIRGGVTTSTANVGMVYYSDNTFLNHSAINPCFSLLTSISKQQNFAEQFNFFPEEKREKIFADRYGAQNELTPDTCHLLNVTRPNILIIILESFSANTIATTGGEAHVTPNLNELSKEGILFDHLYANSFRTDRGLVSILNGYLAQPTTSIMKYPAKSQTLPSIAHSLNRQGYTCDMLYGGDINFTNMQSYFYNSGYAAITSDKDFPISERLNKWGANDNVTFNHLYQVIKDRVSETDSWMTTFLTLSSHEPFEVPYHHFEHPYLNSVAFTDSCLGAFVRKVKETPVWDNLLIILTADHGFRYPDKVKDYEPLRYHIPMLWLGGAIREPRVISTLCNQTDLAATLLSQLDLPHEEFRFSKNILTHEPFAFYTFGNGFAYIDSTGYSVYDNESNRVIQESDAQQREQRLEKGRAILQTLYDDLGRR